MKRIVFMGTPDFSVPILQSLIESGHDIVLTVTQPDRPKGRKKVMTPPPVKVEAERHGLPVLQPEKIKNDYEQILAYDPDIIITAAYGQILPQQLLTSPPFGCINVHASLLPELRGGAPIHYAILQGKKETGITIMYMAESLDAGDIISQRKVSIADDDHAGSLHDKLSEVGANLLVDTLPTIFNGEQSRITQDEHLATYAYNIKREQEKIDWQQPHDTVYNHIRGLHPWPGAFTTYEGNVMKIWWGEKDANTYAGTPGEIVHVDQTAFVVVCGDQKGVRITEIQPAGKKRMAVSQYLQGSRDRLQTGTVMGD
ncbi:methionyl-tRNA formyltransferase [Lentibacillus cibarius]|uniref:Methionyl-tRNA formyltransferase n=1 Tax=Lentibacillus cibarius TaxID=2583219 RepID=A0A5S3QNQ1_9BACI|nr:methionyl-tRNA formyltransferase [Lentibacillus cibarius]TMN23530.1 methionyl-tRNA formyltransferase [Lentibacillus cibarius]